MLVGPSGSGKSHLGAIWARAAAARVVAAEALAGAPLVELAAAKALLIEDADRVGAEEAALFHLLNLTRESGAARAPDRARPARRLGPDDRRSRLAASPRADRSLGAPDLDLTRAVLFKLFSDRQLAVDPAVVAYIALRIERSLDAARAIVAALDREALARGKRVTRAMAAEFLRDEPPAE